MNKKSSSKLFFRAFFTILAVLTLVVIGAFCAYMLWEKAPEISDEAPVQVSAQPVNSDSESDDTGTAFSTDRQDGVYTVLLVGNDNGNGNTGSEFADPVRKEGEGTYKEQRGGNKKSDRRFFHSHSPFKL